MGLESGASTYCKEIDKCEKGKRKEYTLKENIAIVT